MRYISTRGALPPRDFEQVLLEGLAPDGGLYLPEELPHFSMAEIAEWRDLSYADLAFAILQRFTGDSIPGEELRAATGAAWRDFDDPEVAPLRPLGEGEWLLELFHGPTLSFKDYALQLLGRLLGSVLSRRGAQALVLGATSGDTGSAAIEGCRHSADVRVVILHPRGRISEVQRRQMTTAEGEGIYNIAIEGSFDDCQAIVKECFAAPSFLPSDWLLTAVNSINWARIMAQMVYYFSSWLRLGMPPQGAVYAVPTGNFGNAYAGCLAQRIGLPVARLAVATNRNDILHRFFSENRYLRGTVQQTLSPSMDITVASNFERLLFDLCGRDGAETAALLQHFQREGSISISAEAWARAREIFTSASVDDEETCRTIAKVRHSADCLLDPHAAVALAAGRRCRQQHPKVPLISLATAHPAKFPEATRRAIGEIPTPPPAIVALYEREEHYQTLPAEVNAVREFIASAVAGS